MELGNWATGQLEFGVEAKRYGQQGLMNRNAEAQTVKWMDSSTERRTEERTEELRADGQAIGH